MQNTVQLWIEDVRTTGGILAPEKCWWYLVDFEHTRGKWKAYTPPQDYQLWMKQAGKGKVIVQKISPSKSTNMLGVYMSPVGDMGDHVEYLRKKAEKWAQDIRYSSQNNKEEIWTAVHRTIPFALCYSLPAVTLTSDQCNYIITPINWAGLQLSGISATLPRAIRTGPMEFGGLGICDPYFQMGTTQIETFVSNLWAKTPTGMLFVITLEDFALEIGLENWWQHDVLAKGLLYATTKSWIQHVFKFALANNVTITLERNFFSKQRVNDATIMSRALDWSGNPPKLRSINKVRMFLNVV
jgi:hypothetical protein